MTRAVVTLAAATIVLVGPPAHACGIMVSPDGSAEVEGFEALVQWEGSRESIVVAIEYASGSDTFAWLMPFPDPPSVDEGSIDPILAARDITTPPQPPTVGAGAGGVDVIGRQVVRDLEFVTLGGTSARGVKGWLADHGFSFHDAQSPVVQAYLERGWVVVAARVLPGAPPEGSMVPVLFRFGSDRPVYPLRLAGSSHGTALPMELYVITPFRPRSTTYPETVVQASDGAFPEAEDRLEIRYSSPLTDQERARLGGPGIDPLPGSWLTRYEAAWQPSTLDADLVLARATNQESVTFEEGPSAILIGAIAVGAAVLLGLGLALLLRRRSRSR